MEKKLTDEEVVKALECCINDKCSEECPYRGKRYDCVYQHRHEKDLLDLINRQKAEIERLTKKTEEAKFWENEYLEWATGFLKTRFDIKDWFTNPETQKPPCTYEFFASTLWEKIRPAMEWLDELKERNEALRKENAELQKQVDELKENQVIECHGMLKGCDIVKQAVKDTAKEILQMVECWEDKPYVSKDDFKESIKQLYGVEVE